MFNILHKVQNTLLGQEIKTLLLVLGSHTNQFHKTRFRGGLRTNVQVLELMRLFSKLLAFTQGPLAKRGRMVFY